MVNCFDHIKKHKKKIAVLLLVCFCVWHVYSRLTFRLLSFAPDEVVEVLYLEYSKEKSGKGLIKKLRGGGAECSLIDPKYYHNKTERETREKWFCNYWYMKFFLIPKRAAIGIEMNKDQKVLRITSDFYTEHLRSRGNKK